MIDQLTVGSYGSPTLRDTKITFVSNRDGNDEIYVMNADGTNQTRLTSNAAFDSNPSFSPDGSKIAFQTDRDGNLEVYSMNSYGGGETNLTKLPSTIDDSPSWSRYLPRTPKTLIGAGGALTSTAAGFLFGQRDTDITSVVAFETTTPASRTGARVAAQSAPSNEQGTNLIFSITTTAGLDKLWFLNGGYHDIPGQVRQVSIPSGTTGALVSFSASQGTVTTVIPYAANRSVATRAGDNATFTGSFTAVFDENGKNLAPNGAKSVTLDEKTGKLVRFE